MRRTQYRHCPSYTRHHAFTLIELLVVIALIAILAALLTPSLKRARLTAANAVCLSNMRQIAVAIAVFMSDRDMNFPIATEAPWKGNVHGPRQFPLILHDEQDMNIYGPSSVWRCPLDRRPQKRHYKAWYYYYEGGPGSRFEAPYTPPNAPEFQASYSVNAVFRFTSDRSPNSYLLPPGGSGKTRKRNQTHAATPSQTVWFYDSGWSWPVNADSPWQLFYQYATLEYLTIPGRSDWHHQYGQLRRHKPSIWPDPNNVENIGPYGNMCFLDSHVESGIDFFDTFDITAGNPLNDPLAIKWWSLTGQ